MTINIVVTGTSRGIGRAISERLNQHGVRIVGHARWSDDAATGAVLDGYGASDVR